MSKTKWKLAEALKKLMKEKSLHKITIQDIVEESGLTRQSFYYHFHDIDRKSTRLNSSHVRTSRMPSSA